jgi:uncharacterized protein (TIRG00374 family)
LFNRVKKLLRVTVAAILLYYIFSYIGLDAVIETIGDANIPLLFVAFCIAIIVQFVVSYRLKCLTDMYQLNLPTLLVFEVNLATRFFGLFLPGGNFTALLIRIFKFTKVKSQIAGVVMSLLADRVVATLLLCFLGLFFGTLVQPKPDDLWLITFALATLGCMVLTYIVFVQSLSRQPGRIIRLLQKFSPGLWSKLSKIFQHPPRTENKILLNSLWLSLLAHLLGITGYWLVAQSLEMNISLLIIAWVRSGMILVTLIPITIAGLGVREVSALLLLQLYGVEPDIIIAFSMLVFATSIFGIGLLGGLTEAWRFTIGKQ